MLEEDKNLKNSVKDASSISAGYQTQVGIFNGHSFVFGSYTKTNKLITALYMVTDILDNNEPLRNKLRSLGADIISDISSFSGHRDLSNFISQKVVAIISLLDISLAMNLISEMNCNILKKEFIELKEAVQKSSLNSNIFSNISLSEFFKQDEILDKKNENNFLNNINNNVNKSKGQMTRIGVQKGSTLMNALNKIERKSLEGTKIVNIKNMSVKGGLTKEAGSFRSDFDKLKKERREEIIKIIKSFIVNTNEKGATITDIKNSASGVLASCGEKTLQRELVAMVSDGVLKKIGEKRWSKYFL